MMPPKTPLFYLIFLREQIIENLEILQAAILLMVLVLLWMLVFPLAASSQQIQFKISLKLWSKTQGVSFNNHFWLLIVEVSLCILPPDSTCPNDFSTCCVDADWQCPPRSQTLIQRLTSDHSLWNLEALLWSLLIQWHPKYSWKQVDPNPMLRTLYASSPTWLSDRNLPFISSFIHKAWDFRLETFHLPP